MAEQMPRCRTCRWWDTRNMLGEVGSCKHVSLGEPGTGNFIAYPQDYVIVTHDGLTRLDTGPDFGCIHHEPKQTDPTP